MRFLDFFLAVLVFLFILARFPMQPAAVTVVVGGSVLNCSNIFSAALFFDTYTIKI
jgi:hypothetical protein